MFSQRQSWCAVLPVLCILVLISGATLASPGSPGKRLGYIDFGYITGTLIPNHGNPWDPESVRQVIRENLEMHLQAGFDEVYIVSMYLPLIYSSEQERTLFDEELALKMSGSATTTYLNMWRISMAVRETDPFGIAVDEAHKLGLTVYGGYRMNDNVLHGLWNYPEEYWAIFEDEFHKEHAQYWIQTPDPDPGMIRTRPLSYAYPEVRRQKVSILVEQVLKYDVDGLILDFMRFEYISGFDPPAVAEFRNKYGEEPTEEDERWWEIRCGYVVALLEELVEALVVHGKADLPIGIRVPVAQGSTYMRGEFPRAVGTDPIRNALFLGFDLLEIAERGLVDFIILGEIRGQGIIPYPTKPFVQLLAPYDVELYAGFQDERLGYMAYQQSVTDLNLWYQLWIRSFQQAGVNNVVVYESEAVVLEEARRKLLRDLFR